MTIDEAIKHCLEVAEKNDGEAEVYDLLAKNHNNTYEKLTASRFYADCAECATDHRQLAEWLTELKEAKRLLKLAVEDLERLADDEICFSYCDERCPFDCMGGCEEKHWKHLDEALKLVES